MSEVKRIFYGKVLIIGQTGSGKSYLSKTANKDTTGYINVERQPLPYKGTFKFMGQPRTWAGFMKNLEDYGKNEEITHIIIDSQSMAFDMLHKEMKAAFKGFDIYGNYNKEVTRYFDLLRDIQKDIIVISHDEVLADQGFKIRKAKVHGKEFEGRIEAYYTIALYADKRVKDNKPQFFLKTFEPDTSSKTPEGLFPDKNGDNLLEIPNDAEFIFKALETYYQ
jgi:energy-coupling factor transporter ATP-binding protein EcfA2